MIALVLVEVTSPIIGTYSTHATEIWNIYVSNNGEISNLTQTDCKENAFEGNDYAISSHGFRAVNCITSYNKKVFAETKLQNDKLREISPGLDSVALNVIRAYLPPSNPMVDGEVIESLINSTYANTVAQWNSVRPDISTMRTTFQNNLSAFGVTLGTCFNSAKTYMQTMSNLVREQVLECIEYSGSRRDQFIADLKKKLVQIGEHYDEMVAKGEI